MDIHIAWGKTRIYCQMIFCSTPNIRLWLWKCLFLNKNHSIYNNEIYLILKNAIIWIITSYKCFLFWLPLVTHGNPMFNGITLWTVDNSHVKGPLTLDNLTFDDWEHVSRESHSVCLGVFTLGLGKLSLLMKAMRRGWKIWKKKKKSSNVWIKNSLLNYTAFIFGCLHEPIWQQIIPYYWLVIAG